MKKIINGRMYNTDTATFIANYDNGCSRGDFNYIAEELYRKRTGEYFLLGSGGAMTGYRVSCGCDSYCGSTQIIPLTDEEAKEWLEAHADADAYIKCFGEPEE